MLTLETFNILLKPLGQRRRLIVALKALGWTHGEAAERINRKAVTVKMALSSSEGSQKPVYRERVFEELERVIRAEVEE